MSEILKKTGAVLGTAALIGGGFAGMAATTSEVAFAGQSGDAIEQAAPTATPEAPSTIPVQGDFSFTQNATTGNDEIAGIFSKAAATLCDSLPLYGVEQSGTDLGLSMPGTDVSVDLSDAEALDIQDRILGCACATNMPGGGAIMNAEVSGVTFESLLAFVSSSVS